MTHATHHNLPNSETYLLVAGIRSSRLIFQVEEKKEVIVFQVNEAVPVMFRGELSWHSASPAIENVKSYLEISGTRGRTCCVKDLCSLQGITCSAGLFALSPVTDHRRKESHCNTG